MGRKGTRYTLDEKLFYINLANQGTGPRAVQRMYGVKDDQLRQWIKRYKQEGIAGLRHRPLGKYSVNFKLKIVLEYLAGNTSYPQLCDKYNIPNVLVLSISGYICILVVNNLPLGACK